MARKSNKNGEKLKTFSRFAKRDKRKSLFIVVCGFE